MRIFNYIFLLILLTILQISVSCRDSDIFDENQVFLLDGSKYYGDGELKIGYFDRYTEFKSTTIGKIKNGIIDVNFPLIIPEEHMTTLGSFNIAGFETFFVSSNDKIIGDVYLSNGRLHSFSIELDWVTFIFSEKAINLNGEIKGRFWDNVSLNKGWNRILTHKDLNSEFAYSNDNIPRNLKWYFE
jgi:hypothetical protein